LKKSDILKPLEEKQSGVDHKPAQLFEYVAPKR